jgi:hypothetical protein
MPKTPLVLSFHNDGVLYATIAGEVESCEATPFAKEPEATASIICFDPSFIAPAPVVTAGNSVATIAEQTVVYSGSVETGYVFQLNVNRSISGFTLYNRRPDGTMRQMDVAIALVAGDVVKISTEFRNKYATLTRAGVTTSILYAVNPTANWGPLNPGNNFYRVLIAGAAVPFTLTYTPKYGGL